MDSNYILLITVLFTLLLLLAQRAEAKRRRTLHYSILFLAVALWWIRWHLRTEHVIGVLIALLLSYFFWLLIGRYNPVGSSDEIKVYGLND
jgi:hypothetical protein